RDQSFKRDWKDSILNTRVSLYLSSHALSRSLLAPSSSTMILPYRNLFEKSSSLFSGSEMALINLEAHVLLLSGGFVVLMLQSKLLFIQPDWNLTMTMEVNGGIIVSVVKEEDWFKKHRSRVKVIDYGEAVIMPVSKDEAVRRAEDAELDLVILSPHADPPVTVASSATANQTSRSTGKALTAMLGQSEANSFMGSEVHGKGAFLIGLVLLLIDEQLITSYPCSLQLLRGLACFKRSADKFQWKMKMIIIKMINEYVVDQVAPSDTAMSDLHEPKRRPNKELVKLRTSKKTKKGTDTKDIVNFRIHKQTPNNLRILERTSE
ncbi:hypothetical protein HID58_049223, partial [Brassica napus]